MERADIPPRGEGLNAGEELGPHQEAGSLGDTRQDSGHDGRGEAGFPHRCFLHQGPHQSKKPPQPPAW